MENEVVDTCENINTDFYQQTIGEEQQKAIAQIRAAYDLLNKTIGAIVLPVDSRRAAIARTKLEEACMFSIKAICTA